MKLLLTFAVKSDKEIRASDWKSTDLILFGTAETNELIARFADKLPLRLNAGAADYGLVFVAPNEGHYLVVNSGLPWWTSAETAKRGQLSFLPPAAILNTFQDYILFKGDLSNVVAEGRFDRKWNVPSAAAHNIAASGAAQVRTR